MKCSNFTFKSNDGLEIFVYKWTSSEEGVIKGIVQIAHGMAETAARYEYFAEKLVEAGYIVYAHDHRGHGKTAGEVEKLGDLGEDGFNLMVENLHELNEIIKKENPNLPVFLLGHSMGSFVSQRFICVYGKDIDGVILSGSCGNQAVEATFGRIIAKLETKRIGRTGKSNFMDKLSFGNFNKCFKPNKTGFDWLSRDKNEVDKYINDPFCGTVFTAGFFYDFLGGIKLIADYKEVNKVPKELPIFIFSGDKDPVGKNGKGVIKLVNTYKEIGIKDVSYILYKEGRHEMLNEVNKDEVIENVIKWLEAKQFR